VTTSSEIIPALSTPWQGEPPDPVTHPDLYRGVMMRRVLAYVVDIIAIVLISLLAGGVFIVAGIATLGLLAPVLWPIYVLIPFIYNMALIGGGKSATFGMRLFEIEVRNILDGTRPYYIQAGLMTALFYLSVAFTSWLILLLALFNSRHRTLHDFFSTTLVVRSQAMGELKSKTS